MNKFIIRHVTTVEVEAETREEAAKLFQRDLKSEADSVEILSVDYYYDAVGSNYVCDIEDIYELAPH